MSGRTDTASLVIPAVPAAVYRALTDPTALESWLPPDGMSGAMHSYDARPGGGFQMTLRYDAKTAREQEPPGESTSPPGPGDPGGAGKTTADTDVIEARIAELSPDERVVWLVRFDSDDPAFAGEMRMSWTLAPLNRGSQRSTRVTIRAQNVPAGISRSDHDQGLRSSLANLARFLSSAS